MSNEKSSGGSNRTQNEKHTPVRDKHESGTALNRQCPTGGSNKSNNISQSQMTPPRPTSGDNGGKEGG
jgi:hypothetical protein